MTQTRLPYYIRRETRFSCPVRAACREFLLAKRKGIYTMKRLASLLTAAAITGSLLGAAMPAQALSEMYLVPISPLNAYYAPGSIVKFAAVIDLNNGNFASLTVPFATAFTTADFTYQTGSAGVKPKLDASAPNGGQPSQINPNSGDYIFNRNAQAYATTASKINGNTVFTFQNTVGQTADSDINGNTLAIAAGTYTIGVFAFPISSTNTSGRATIYLPTPYGFTSSANSADGAYVVGIGPTNTINGKDVNGNFTNELITFPSTTGTPTDGKYSSLTYTVSSGYSAIFGVINLGLAPNAAPQPITLVATSRTTYQSYRFVVPIGPVAGNTYSNFNVPVPSDYYDVTFQGSKWLKQDIPYVHAFTSPIYGGYISTTLTGGDANGDNSVDSTDFGLLIGAYGSSAAISGNGYIAGADFDCDGLVDSTDFGILINNFGVIGAP